MTVRTALYYHQEHPEITFRSDAFLLGLYRMGRTLLQHFVPDAKLPPDYSDLSQKYLHDMVAFIAQEDAERQKSKRSRSSFG